jgi:sodium-dependent phosphate cotransporter
LGNSWRKLSSTFSHLRTTPIPPSAGTLFGDNNNPVAGLVIGILVTCLLQSSSTTTFIIVTLVGAGAVSIQQSIYMVMGANIGTSVTNTIVAIGQLADGDELEHALAGATVHYMFNFLCVAIFFPLELISGMFFYLTSAIVKNLDGDTGSDADGFVKKYIAPVGVRIITVNKDVTQAVAQGGTCDSFYPTSCEDPSNPSGETCNVGLVACEDDFCPVLFEAGATRVADQTAGATAFLIGLTILFLCLFGLVKTLHGMMKSASTRVMYKATDINGYLAIVIGCGITLLVQSSSITTSTLTPFIGLNLIRLEQML